MLTRNVTPVLDSRARSPGVARFKAPWPTGRRLGAWLLACYVAIGPGMAVLAQTETSEAVINREYPLKAIFLYNFGGYVEWPTETFRDTSQPFVIGLLGTAPVEQTLIELSATKKINGRRIVVERYASVDAIKACQILFIARGVSTENHHLAVDKLQNQPVLIVGESEGFAKRGGSVNFLVEANKIRFEINIEVAKQQQLKISSKLLALAKIVQ